MPSVLIRELDDATLERLKQRAAANNRSLQGELRSIVETAAQTTPRTKKRRPLRIPKVAIKTSSNYSRDEMYAEETP